MKKNRTAALHNDNPFTFSLNVFYLPFISVLLLGLIFYVEQHYIGDLGHYGIYPREWFGLKGILFSPFLHSSYSHLFNNSMSLFVLLGFLQYFYRKQTILVIVAGIIFSGLGTWLMGRPSYHIGASGLVYVLVSFIFFKGIFTKYYRLMALSFVVVLLYGGLLWYMFPGVGEERISWEGHLFGFLTGLALALLVRTPQFKKQPIYTWEFPDFDPQQDPFIKNFDDNGNFVPVPKPEEVIKNYFTTSIKVLYDFIESKAKS